MGHGPEPRPQRSNLPSLRPSRGHGLESLSEGRVGREIGFPSLCRDFPSRNRGTVDTPTPPPHSFGETEDRTGGDATRRGLEGWSVGISDPQDPYRAGPAYVIGIAGCSEGQCGTPGETRVEMELLAPFILPSRRTDHPSL